MKKHKIQNVREPANEYEAELVKDAKRFSISLSATLLCSLFAGMEVMNIAASMLNKELIPSIFWSIVMLSTYGIAAKSVMNSYNLYTKRNNDIKELLDMPVEETKGEKVK